MTTTDLYNEALKKLPIQEIHPLHKAMLEECCENALKNEQGVTDLKTLIFAVQVSFVTCEKALKATLKTSVQGFGADGVTLNYRRQTFSLPLESSFLK